MALYSRLPSGGTNMSRSTKIHNGSVACSNNVENTVFEVVGGGKINRLTLKPELSSTATVRFAIIVDDVELYEITKTASNVEYHLFRTSYSVLNFTDAYTGYALPLDIEFQNNLRIILFPDRNISTVSYTVEISKN